MLLLIYELPNLGILLVIMLSILLCIYYKWSIYILYIYIYIDYKYIYIYTINGLKRLLDFLNGLIFIDTNIINNLFYRTYGETICNNI